MPTLQTLKYRARYWWRKACHLAGFCPNCGNRINRTPSGAVFCPVCKQR